MSGFYITTPAGKFAIDDFHANNAPGPTSANTGDFAKLGTLYSPITESYYNPTNCAITNSANAIFNCYKVPANHIVKSYYKFPSTATAVGLNPNALLQNEGYVYYGLSQRYNGAAVTVDPDTGTFALQGNSDATPVTLPDWCNSLLVYSVGGGGGGGGKGGRNPSYNSGNGADGANGGAAVDEIAISSNKNIIVSVGQGGEGGKGTGNPEGDGRPGGRSFVRYPTAGSGTVYALALGGAGGNGGNSAGTLANGNSGNLQSDPYGNEPVLNTSGIGQQPPASFPPTLQNTRTNTNPVGGSIGYFGNGQASDNNAAGSPGGPGMVALFYKTSSWSAGTW